MVGFESALFPLFEQKSVVDEWLVKKQQETTLPVYGSFDIRDAGWKVVVVDSNAFPAGFNNLKIGDHEILSLRLRDWFSSLENTPNQILIWPEGHSRNSGYMENLIVIKSLIENLGFEVLIGTDILSPQSIHTSRGILDFVEIKIDEEHVYADGKLVDHIILNADLSEGSLELPGVKISPPDHMGWHIRSKCNHFSYVSKLVHELGDLVGIDPWLIGPWGFISKGRCLDDQLCRERLAGEIQQGLDFIQSKYDEHGIDANPSLFIKNDKGTYGLGVLRIDSPEEIINLSNRKKNRLTYAKGGNQAEDFLLQEAVPTSIQSLNSVIEPVGYGINGDVCSWFYRSNEKYGVLDNLNTPSTQFLLFDDLSSQASKLVNSRRWLHKLVADISMIAMGLEEENYASSVDG